MDHLVKPCGLVVPAGQDGVARDTVYNRISHKVFYKRQFPHKPVNLFLILVIAKDKLTDSEGS